MFHGAVILFLFFNRMKILKSRNVLTERLGDELNSVQHEHRLSKAEIPCMFSSGFVSLFHF